MVEVITCRDHRYLRIILDEGNDCLLSKDGSIVEPVVRLDPRYYLHYVVLVLYVKPQRDETVQEREGVFRDTFDLDVHQVLWLVEITDHIKAWVVLQGFNHLIGCNGDHLKMQDFKLSL